MDGGKVSVLIAAHPVPSGHGRFKTVNVYLPLDVPAHVCDPGRSSSASCAKFDDSLLTGPLISCTGVDERGKKGIFPSNYVCPVIHCRVPPTDRARLV